MQTENLVSDIMEGIINDKIDFSNEDNITIWMIQLLLYFTKTKDNIVDRLISSNSNSTVFIIKATEGNFITSDNPIIRYDCTPKGTLILYPISPKLCLCFGKGKEVKIPMVKQYNIMSANKTIVAFINNIVYQQARDYIISKSEDYIYSETAKPFMELLEMWKQIDYFSPM